MREARYDRETTFHDKTFAEGTRRQAEKFYSITHNSSKAFYRKYLTDHCLGSRVLEYGCGPDSHGLMLAQRGGRVTGIDISSVAVSLNRTAAARQPNASISFCVMNAEDLSFQNGTFDLICGMGILHHLDLERSYRELSRTLKAEGSAIFLEPLGHNPLINLYRRLTPSLRTPDEHPLLSSDLEMAAEYFESVELTYFHLTSLIAVVARRSDWFGKVLRRLEHFDNFLFRKLPWARNQAWAVAIILSKPKALKSTSPGRDARAMA